MTIKTYLCGVVANIADSLSDYSFKIYISSSSNFTGNEN